MNQTRLVRNKQINLSNIQQKNPLKQFVPSKELDGIGHLLCKCMVIRRVGIYLLRS